MTFGDTNFLNVTKLHIPELVVFVLKEVVRLTKRKYGLERYHLCFHAMTVMGQHVMEKSIVLYVNEI